MTARVLVIDDDRTIRLIVERGLTEAGFNVCCASTAEEGLRLLESFMPHVALIDVYLPEINGLELYQKLRALDRKVPIIFITADCSSETTIEAMRLGAFDYLPKPLNLTQLRVLTTSAAESRRLMDEPVAMSLTDQVERGDPFIGRSAPMMEVFKAIGRVAGQNVAVLVRGETGCGKELAAKAIVQHSPRRDAPFVSVNCAAIPDQLLESELFGVEKGAFTGADKRREGKFEYANGGTVFLDEVGDMSLMVQGKVLRVLQEQKFQRLGGNNDISTDVRIIAATHRNLEQMVSQGLFREDLFYRLNGYTIQLPSLRERRDDIPLLLDHFLSRARREMKKPDVEGLSPAALQALVEYPWPGNIRQLQSVVRQSMLCTTGTVIGVDSLPKLMQETFVFETGLPTSVPLLSTEPDYHAEMASPNRFPLPDGQDQLEHEVPAQTTVPSVNTIRPPSLDGLADFIEERIRSQSTNLYAEAIEELERYLFRRVLEVSGGNQSKAAGVLGITRGKVRDRILKLLNPR